MLSVTTEFHEGVTLALAKAPGAVAAETSGYQSLIGFARAAILIVGQAGAAPGAVTVKIKVADAKDGTGAVDLPITRFRLASDAATSALLAEVAATDGAAVMGGDANASFVAVIDVPLDEIEVDALKPGARYLAIETSGGADTTATIQTAFYAGVRKGQFQDPLA